MSTPEKERKFRTFPLTNFAVNHPTSVFVLTAIIIILGLSAYLTIPKESAPEITIPNILVVTVYPGTSPKDMETLITRVLEEELNGIADVKEMTSISQEGYSNINIEFKAGMDMNEALQRVREKVDIAKVDLPSAAEEPEIIEINFSEFPIMQVNVSGNYDLVRLRDVAEDLQDEIELIASVLEVDLAGGLEREVQVDVDLRKLKFYGVAFDDVIDAIREENVTIPGGPIDVGNLKYLVRVPGEFETTGPVADIVVLTSGGRSIHVRDVATVDFGFKERDSYARLDGKDVVSLSVKKRSGENIIETAGRVREVIAREEGGFPTGTVVKITADESQDIKDMVSSLENNIISGLILVTAVLLFFLGFRTASFVGMAIPLSMLLSFSILSMVGITMNMVVLFSLILALGMLVDNAIVVVENIYRFHEQGNDRKTSAKRATGEVAIPIIAATATTLAAFFPMTFWPGIVGEFMKFLPLTLIITLSSSLFVALVILPTVCSRFLLTEDERAVGLVPAAKYGILAVVGLLFLVCLILNWVPTVLLTVTGVGLYFLYNKIIHPIGHWFMTIGMADVLVRYTTRLTWALGHRWKIIVGAVAALFVAIVAFMFLNAGIEFFPEDIPPSAAYVQIEAPLGTRVELTDRIAHEIEGLVREVPGAEDYESVLVTVGQQVSGGFGGGQGSHLGTVILDFVDIQDQQVDARATMALVRELLSGTIAGASVSVEEPQMGPPTGRPINIEIAGDDPDQLKRLGDEMVLKLERSTVFSKLDGLESDLSDARPEMIIDVDREKAALYGLSTMDIGFTVRSAIGGTEASTYRDGKDEYDITVRLAKSYRDDLDALGDLTVTNESGDQIPLSSVASWRVGQGFGGVNRKDLDRVVTVSSDVRPGNNANAVLAEVQGELVAFAAAMPQGYEMRYTGQQEEQDESQAFLTGAFIMAIFLIGFILVSQFDSLIKPLIILSSVLLSTIGVLIGLIVFRMPFGIIMTGVGVISLAGVVVNNAIVLIDYIGVLQRRDGLSRTEAIIKGGRTRFRPVILTAITTVLGLVPLAIGLNFDYVGLYTQLSPELFWGGEQASWWGPMAIAVIAGLSFATFLTLILVPVMYSMAGDLDTLLKRSFTRIPVPRHELEPEPETDKGDGREPDAPREPGTSPEPAPA
jgi:multidrug efflux pump subunit AcrB